MGKGRARAGPGWRVQEGDGRARVQGAGAGRQTRVQGSGWRKAGLGWRVQEGERRARVRGAGEGRQTRVQGAGCGKAGQERKARLGCGMQEGEGRARAEGAGGQRQDKGAGCWVGAGRTRVQDAGWGRAGPGCRVQEGEGTARVQGAGWGRPGKDDSRRWPWKPTYCGSGCKDKGFSWAALSSSHRSQVLVQTCTIGCEDGCTIGCEDGAMVCLWSAIVLQAPLDFPTLPQPPSLLCVSLAPRGQPLLVQKAVKPEFSRSTPVACGCQSLPLDVYKGGSLRSSARMAF